MTIMRCGSSFETAKKDPIKGWEWINKRVHLKGSTQWEPKLGRSICGPTCGRYFQWEQKVLDFAPQMNKDTCLMALFYASLLNQRTLLVVRSVSWKSTRIDEDVPFDSIRNFIGRSLCSIFSNPGSISGKDWRFISH